MCVGRQNTRRIGQCHVFANLCVDASNDNAILHEVSTVFDPLDFVNHPLHRDLGVQQGNLFFCCCSAGPDVMAV
tara:strand:+ start:780 stop:1001 length:222 start_codon:yes stop_codon:yes gene_type:complete